MRGADTDHVNAAASLASASADISRNTASGFLKTPLFAPCSEHSTSAIQHLSFVAAAIIGGTSFSGGLGTAGGTLAGAFIVGFLNNIMNLLGIQSYLQQIIKGGIIAIAVAYDVMSKNRKTASQLGNIEDRGKEGA